MCVSIKHFRLGCWNTQRRTLLHLRSFSSSFFFDAVLCFTNLLFLAPPAVVSSSFPFLSFHCCVLLQCGQHEVGSAPVRRPYGPCVPENLILKCIFFIHVAWSGLVDVVAINVQQCCYFNGLAAQFRRHSLNSSEKSDEAIAMIKQTAFVRVPNIIHLMLLMIESGTSTAERRQRTLIAKFAVICFAHASRLIEWVKRWSHRSINRQPNVPHPLLATLVTAASTAAIRHVNKTAKSG